MVSWYGEQVKNGGWVGHAFNTSQKECPRRTPPEIRAEPFKVAGTGILAQAQAHGPYKYEVRSDGSEKLHQKLHRRRQPCVC